MAVVARTALSTQLAQLALAAGDVAHRLPKGKPSLLYDPKEAADIDITTIYHIGCSGLDELCEMDPRFEVFRSTLFSAAGKELDRQMEVKEVNEQLDKSLHAFLRLLSNYFLLSPAHKTLEFLIRRYSIYQYNVDSIVSSFLPYHQTAIFVRLMQLMRLEGSIWSFLAGIREAGAAMPRTQLVQQCAKDTALLLAICDAAVEVSSAEYASSRMLCFYAVVVMETLAVMPAVTNEFLPRIIPYISKGLQKGVAPDFVAGTYMVLMQLAHRVVLAPELAQALVEAVARAPANTGGSESDALLALLMLAQTQGLQQLPDRAFTALLKFRDLPAELNHVSLKYDVAPLLRLIISSHIQHCVGSEDCEQGMQALITKVPLGSLANDTAAALLRLLSTESKSEIFTAAVPTMQRLLRALDLRYPQQVDKQINAVLKQRRKSSGGLNGEQQGADALSAFLNETFSFSYHKPLEESQSSLLLSLSHAKAHIRALAINGLADMVEPDTDQQEELRRFVQDAMLRIMREDESEVVLSVLNHSRLVDIVPAEPLFEALSATLQSAHDTVVGGSADKAAKQAAQSVMKQALQLVGTELAARDDAPTERIVLLLLQYSLVMPKTRKRNLQARSLASSLDHPLMQGVSVQEQDNSGKDADKQLNASAVEAMAGNMLGDVMNLLPLVAQVVSTAPERNAMLLLALQQFLTLVDLQKTKKRSAVLSLLPTVLAAYMQGWRLLEDKPDAQQHIQPLEALNLTTSASDAAQHINIIDTKTVAAMVVRGLYGYIQCISSGTTTDVHVDAFKALSTPRSASVFKRHLHLLVSATESPVQYLIDMVTSEAEKRVHVMALELLSSVWDTAALENKGSNATSPDALQLGLPALLVALRSAGSAVRESAVVALQALSRLVSTDLMLFDNRESTDVLLAADYLVLVESLVDAREGLKSDAGHLPAVLSQLLLPIDDDAMDTTIFTGDAQERIVAWLATRAVQLPTEYAQHALLASLVDAGHDLQQAKATQSLLQSLLAKPASLTPAQAQIVTVVLPHYAAAVSSDAANVDLATLFMRACAAGAQQDDGTLRPVLAQIQEVAVCHVGASLFEALSDDRKVELLSHLLRAVNRGTDVKLRASARVALEKLPLPADVYVQFIVAASGSGGDDASKTASKRRKTPAKTTARSNQLPEALSILAEPDRLALAVFALETLQWKGVSGDQLVLAAPLYTLLTRLLEGNLAVQPAPVDGEDADAGQAGSVDFNLEYIIQLVLQNIEQIVRAADAPSTTTPAGKRGSRAQGRNSLVDLFQVVPIVQCIERQNPTTRNHAVAVLAALARLLPDQVLERVLDVFTVMSTTTLTQGDATSFRVTLQMLEAVVPSWLATSRNVTQLLQVFVNALPHMSLDRRVPLFDALLRALSADYLHTVLLLLLRVVVRRRAEGEEGSVAWALDFAEQVSQLFAGSTRVTAYVQLLAAAEGDDISVRVLACTTIASHIATSQFLPARAAVSAANDQEALHQGYAKLMERALLMVSAQSDESSEVNTAAYNLLEGLATRLEDETYITGVTSLIGHANKHVRRKALRLLSNKLSQLEGGRAAAPAEAATYLSKLQPVADRLQAPKESSKAKQAALFALHTAARALGRQAPEALASLLPPVLASVSSANSSVATSAVTASAGVVAALGTQALPHLPAMVDKVLSIGNAAAEQSAATDDTNLQEEQSLLLAACLTALQLLLTDLGPFLSPYVQRIVTFLLQPHVITCEAAGVSATSAAVRVLIPEKVPTRLLVDPLLATYSAAVSGGDASLVCLFQLVGSLASSLNRAAATTHHKAMFNFFVKAFNLRQQQPDSVRDIEEVETAMVASFMSLVMKLSESTFKPLFLTILSWATASDEAQPALTNKRGLVLFRVTNALAHRLRSVFVPYFKYLLDLAVRLLTAQQVVVPERKARSSKKAKLAADAVKAIPVDVWRLRTLVVLALHKCFLYDNVGFLDALKYERLQPSVVGLLDAYPSPEALALRVRDADGQEVGFCEAVVQCIAQMAVATGTDALWQPLNRSVLMKLRTRNVSTIEWVLRVVSETVERLQNNFTPLIPETLTFLAEAMELGGDPIVNIVRGMILRMQEVSGEDLQEYMKF
eukprot:jgi/Chlat1/5192/Chrsp33S05163